MRFSFFLYLARNYNQIVMKKILLIALLGLFIFSCKKSDDPAKPAEKYKVTYSFSAVGLDTLEYIKYLNADGSEVSISDTNAFNLSFEQPSNNIHGRISIKGTTGTLSTSYADYSMTVTDKNDGIIYTKESGTNFPETSFTWSAEYKNIEN